MTRMNWDRVARETKAWKGRQQRTRPKRRRRKRQKHHPEWAFKPRRSEATWRIDVEPRLDADPAVLERYRFAFVSNRYVLKLRTKALAVPIIAELKAAGWHGRAYPIAPESRKPEHRTGTASDGKEERRTAG